MRSPSRPFRRFRRLVTAVLAAVLLTALTACTTVRETGRKQFNLLNEETEVQMGIEAYQQALEGQPVSTDPAINDLVKRVGDRIAKASGRTDYKWEFTVIDDPKMVNAWALPGGKVAVYTGILKVTQTEAGLATVMGHEVAHATARHGAERMTQQLLLKGGETALALALQNREATVVQPVMAAFGLGAQVGVLLPFSRKQELEADRIGLQYMAQAGYDPKEAIEFWKRMNALAESSGSPPEFLSTHPSHETRIEDLQKWLPEAQALYRPQS